MSKPSLDAYLRTIFPPKLVLVSEQPTILILVPASEQVTIPTPMPGVKQTRRTSPTTQMRLTDVRRAAYCVPDCTIGHEPAAVPSSAGLRAIVGNYFRENGYSFVGSDMDGAKIWCGPEKHEVGCVVSLNNARIEGYVLTRS